MLLTKSDQIVKNDRPKVNLEASNLIYLSAHIIFHFLRSQKFLSQNLKIGPH